MKLHPRHQPMARARLAIDAAVIAMVQEFDLTEAEVWSILSQVSESWAKGALRAERAQAGNGDGE